MGRDDAFGWDRCDHRGIGKLGCETCDPVELHRYLRQKYLVQELSRSLAECLDELAANLGGPSDMNEEEAALLGRGRASLRRAGVPC